MPAHEEIIELYRYGQEANLADPLRKGQHLEFTAGGEVVMTGDLHGNERNLDKIVRFAGLGENPDRHLILHELLHETEASAEGCFSFRLLERALRLQKAFPQRVHLLLGNHALCQVLEKPVIRYGEDAVDLLRAGLEKAYGQYAGGVCNAMHDFLLSEPLAARLPNRIMLSHSLPSPAKMSMFDPRVLYQGQLADADLQADGSAYLMLWGRHHTAEQLAELGKEWDVDLFVVGHQPQEMGFSVPNSRQIILSSDHNHGCCLLIDLSRSYTIEALAEKIVKLAGVG
ncbi:MAG: hypothetical protein GWP14_05460 [Actinobacteria bacterium]|nr:hypothetical protein [Actinomycetota bacterium]